MEPADNEPKYENKIIKMPKLNYEPDSRGLGFVYFQFMSRHKDSCAQIDALTGEKENYGSLLQRCVRTALEMRNRGVGESDIIALCTDNHTSTCVPFIAGLFLGANVCSLDPSISRSDTVHLIKQVRPKIFFVSEQAVKLIQDSLEDAELQSSIVVFGPDFAQFLEPSRDENSFQPVAAKSVKDTAIIFFSSGTTGLPKGICINHYALLYQSNSMNHIGYTIKRMLYFSSLYWISAAIFLTQCIMSGNCRIIYSKYDANMIWQIIDKYKVTFMFMAPSQAVALTKISRPDDIDTTSLSELLIAGGAFSENQMLSLRDILPGTHVYSAYGQTEVAGCITCFKSNIRREVLLSHKNMESVGRPMTDFWYKVVDLETEELLGPNQQGELRIKTDCSMNGYYQLDSSAAWDKEGFLHTGDVAYYDDDFCLYIVDRIKEMLKFQSWHVPPALLEGILLSHPAVQLAVVIGLPHPEDGDHPLGIVILKEGHEDVTAEDLINFVDSKVDDRQKLRGGIKFVDSIPLTPSGKPMRKVLRSTFC